MSKLTLVRDRVHELLSLAYVLDDVAQMEGSLDRSVTGERLRVLKEMGELVGMRSVERRRCRNCGGFLPFGMTYMYCNNACKQSAYRKRKVRGL